MELRRVAECSRADDFSEKGYLGIRVVITAKDAVKDELQALKEDDDES